MRPTLSFSALGLILGLVALTAATRLLPHPPNFTPVIALALFCGAALPKRWMGLAAIGGVMLLTDLLLGWHASLLAVYATLALITLGGRKLDLNSSAGTVLGGSFAAACLFFLLTNFAVWAGSGMYPPTLEGLVACYVAGIPFFGNSLASTLLFSALLFGLGRRGVHALPGQAQAATA